MNIRSNVRSMAYPIAAVVCLSLGPVVSIGLASDRAIAAKPSPGAAQNVKPNAVTPWKTYTAKQGRFSVLMPGEPKMISAPVTLETGDKATMWGIAAAETATRTAYISAYMDMPIAIDPKSNLAQTSLENGIQTLVESHGYEVISRSRFALKGYPGQEIRYRLQNGNTGRCRIFLVKARLYFLTVESVQDSLVQKNVDRFMQSFKLL